MGQSHNQVILCQSMQQLNHYLVRSSYLNAKEGILVGKTYLESMLDEGGFCSAIEMGGFTLDKGPEVSLVP